MALSNKAKEVLIVACANKKVGQEVAAAIDAGGNTKAAFVAAVSAPTATDLTTAEALANANKAAINAVIASLIAAGLMASS